MGPIGANFSGTFFKANRANEVELLFKISCKKDLTKSQFYWCDLSSLWGSFDDPNMGPIGEYFSDTFSKANRANEVE